MTGFITKVLVATALMAPVASAGAMDTNQTITVTGSHEQMVGRNRATGSPIFEYSVAIVVSTGDLDLRDAADWRRLESRVQEAAWHGCAWLETRYVLARDRDCRPAATRQGMAAARRLVEGQTRVTSLSFGIGTDSGL